MARFPSLLIIVLATSLSAYGSTLPRGIISDANEFSKQNFDYVVVGGGTAGVVVAARLSENPKIRVGLIEAGTYHRDDPKIDRPTGFGQPFGDPNYDWLLKTTPQSALNGRSVAQPRGKLLGGSSAFNAMVWQRAHVTNYNSWANEFGNGQEWSFQSLLPYFKKSENWVSPPIVFPGQINSTSLRQAHGVGGPVQLSYNNYYPASVVKSSTSANALGIPFNNNPDLGNQTDAISVARIIDPKTGKRSYSAPAYYEPNAGRPNFVVLTGALATKILFKKSNTTTAKPIASGVQYIVNGTTYTASAGKEIILSAGSLLTPKLLELSGVGNKTLLQSLGIPVILDLPQVGENLQDHTLLASEFVAKPGVVTQDNLNWNATFAQEQQAIYNASFTGALSYTTAMVFMIPLKSYIESQDFSTLAALFNASAIPTTPLQKVQYSVLQKDLEQARPWTEFGVSANGGMITTPAPNTSYLSPLVLNYHPLARGSVHINSTDPLAPPLINPNYLNNPFDVAVNSFGLSFHRRWFQTAPLADDTAQQNAPAPDVQTRDQLDAYAKANIVTTFHPLGTTAMAPLNIGGVVDPQLRIHGLSNIRIVDAGIFPSTIGAALQPAVYTIAEKAADMIKRSS